MKRSTRVVWAAATAFLLFAAPAARSETPPASEKSRKELVKLADAIEANPLSKDARKQRRKALQIIEGEQSLQLVACRALIGELTMSRSLGAMELRAQLRIAAGRYLADHPSATGTEVEAVVAGLEGLVRAYEAMRRNDPRVAIPEADAIAETYRDGNLGAYAADAMANCDR